MENEKIRPMSEYSQIFAVGILLTEITLYEFNLNKLIIRRTPHKKPTKPTSAKTVVSKLGSQAKGSVHATPESSPYIE